MLATAEVANTGLIARPDVEIAVAEDGTASVSGAWLDLSLGVLGAGALSALQRIFAEPVSEDEQTAAVMLEDGFSAVPEFMLLVQTLEASAVLGRALIVDDKLVASAVPTRALRPATQSEVAVDAPCRLSPFAFWTAQAGDMVIESPLGHGRLILHEPEMAALGHLLATGATIESLSQASNISPQICSEFVALANAAHLLDDADQPSDAAPNMWDFADLLLHNRSRLGRHQLPYGGTYRFVDEVEPETALKPVGSGSLIDLPATEPAFAAGSLGDVMERRRSIRQFGDDPITSTQLGELLARCQRHRQTIPTKMGELASRPYPAGGALYELEIYPVVGRCDGLDRGLYRYVPDTHQLEMIADATPATERLLYDAHFTMAQEGFPDVLLVITARFRRVMWKYQSIAYSLILKHVGVLYQTLYLVATDMGLAGCALGGGNTDLFGDAAGLEYLEEGSVGEFALGTRPADVPIVESAVPGEQPAGRLAD